MFKKIDTKNNSNRSLTLLLRHLHLSTNLTLPFTATLGFTPLSQKKLPKFPTKEVEEYLNQLRLRL